MVEEQAKRERFYSKFHDREVEVSVNSLVRSLESFVFAPVHEGDQGLVLEVFKSGDRFEDAEDPEETNFMVRFGNGIVMPCRPHHLDFLEFHEHHPVVEAHVPIPYRAGVIPQSTPGILWGVLTPGIAFVKWSFGDVGPMTRTDLLMIRPVTPLAESVYRGQYFEETGDIGIME